MKWTDADSAQARAEGWALSKWTVPSTDDTGYQIRAIPMNAFYHDGEAALHVIRKALAGSELHIKALRLDQDNLSWEVLDALEAELNPPEPPEPDYGAGGPTQNPSYRQSLRDAGREHLLGP
jgi:hypothetical protein